MITGRTYFDRGTCRAGQERFMRVRVRRVTRDTDSVNRGVEKRGEGEEGLKSKEEKQDRAPAIDRVDVTHRP